jgi:signal transduction histidine kinase
MPQDPFISARGRKARIRKHLLLWLGVWLFLIVSFPPAGTQGSRNTIVEDGIFRWYGMVTIRCFFYLISQIVFTYAVIYFLLPVFLQKRKYWRFTGLFLLLVIATTVLRYALIVYWYDPLMQSLKFDIADRALTLRQAVDQIVDGPAFVSWTIISLKIYSGWQKRQKDILRLRAENASAELQLLKAQVHPHFLFNTLNNIYSFALDHSPQAKTMIRKLESILRYMTEECDQPLVSLEAEISTIEDYLELERIRYGNSIDMQVEINGDRQGKTIAPLLMMPFVENSFKHGTSKILRSPWIKLFIQADDDRVHFLLTNSKPETKAATGKKGIGLSNVRKRLELLYPSDHLLTIESTPNTFTVNMQIPLSHQK